MTPSDKQEGGSAFPKRIQLRRTKGWRMPDNTVKVTRPGRWGNPFVVGETYAVCDEGERYSHDEVCESPADAVQLYRDWMAGEHGPDQEEIETHLTGKNLACFCALDQPCHADVLLEIANPSLLKARGQ